VRQGIKEGALNAMSQTIAERIAEVIALKIGKRILNPGERLIETAIANEFNTSRAPVREALLMLEGNRLVQRIPHQGMIVRKFSRKEVMELYDVMYRLEEIAMEKALINIQSEDIKRIQSILDEQEKCVERQDIEPYHELNEAFHRELFSIAGNQVLTDTYLNITRTAYPFKMLSLSQSNNIEASFEEHNKQFKAMINKNLHEGKMAIHEQEIRSLKTLKILFPE
jgi:DNA-binding GntR family transcriptional regulator